MNVFDDSIIAFLNQFAGHWFVFDKMVKAIAVNNLFKGGFFAALIWWAWFRNESPDSNKRERVTSTLIAAIASIAVARLLALILPFRFRPIHTEALHFVLPYGVAPELLDGWSSFPSDHAALFFALATGLFFISKRMGIFSLLYATFVICLPRIYIGLHWPTDILGGMVIGVTIAILCNLYLPRIKYVRPLVNVACSQPMYFYPLLFLLTYQIADLFEGSRAVLSAVFQVFKAVF